MAEPVSSIITIATVSIAIIKETISYIKNVHLVDKVVDRLLLRFKDLHKLIKLVESTYRRADAEQENDHSRYIRNYLLRCRDRLRDIQNMLYELPSKESTSFIQKAALKRGMDKVKDDIDLAMSDIHDYMDFIRTGISLDVASAHRRLSEVMAAQQVTTVTTDLHQITAQSLNRTLSNAETLLAYDAGTIPRRSSTETSLSRPSVSSSSSQALHLQSDDNASILSTHDSIPPKPNSEWVDFHFELTKCDGDPSRIDQIRKTLQQHPAASTLAQSTNTSQRTPLHLAAQRGDVQLGLTLLSFGADINAQDSEPASVLDAAVECNQRKFVALLLEHNVDETVLQPRNQARLDEMKRIIEYSKDRDSSARQSPKEKKSSRKMSWGSRRGLSNT
ncbi:hypothetical protein IAQ61_007017 [Plenodomus lingam]|uniref:Uncharacterized protein n=1 Tax=Leptosphaeria maculans (strain JN3 / isolate v23.1.3 / race Av1-4-5-6-7-8) TaxID=985895 RepID=E5AD75_LEPMJ|nr:hypothetical protein LEMA_P012140.1 [Plenodomus lingam JN3]KAH9869804.1 hypothetical protein IAQ61_007017 [Plenodomus lingam]CBY02427.1 hypothetical protein LEMA_P012140.1 [Plenodomus lingam JN3]